MYSLKERNGALQAAPLKPILAAKRRRQLHPFFFHMGPVALCITSVLLIGLMAVLYLSQVGQAVAANQKIQDIHTEQAMLQRQNQDLVYTIAQERSPAYIADVAKRLGLVPADPKIIHVLVVPQLEPTRSHDPSSQP
ncbi:MAG: septum formation initiator family protein [Chloroflexi bacterium]|nr:septum formation initiator family protein [Chloroflexota bacterium]